MKLDDYADDESPQERWEREQLQLAAPCTHCCKRMAPYGWKTCEACRGHQPKVPGFCAVCTLPRKGLVPHRRPDQHGKLRTVYLCLDCDEAGSLAELGQYEVGEGGPGVRARRKGSGGAA